jgi:hypothetical protein
VPLEAHSINVGKALHHLELALRTEPAVHCAQSSAKHRVNGSPQESRLPVHRATTGNHDIGPVEELQARHNAVKDADIADPMLPA